jgi:6-bladed beta-propeller
MGVQYIVVGMPPLLTGRGGDRMARKSAFSAIIFIVVSLLGHGQTIIENPAKALNSNAGRVVLAEEVLRIEETGKEYSFKEIYGVRVSPEGSIFVREGFDHVLQFDPQGVFLRRLTKKGRGPGELEDFSDFLVTSDRVVVTGLPPKLLVYDLNGTLLEEIGLSEVEPRPTQVLAVESGTVFMSREVRPAPDRIQLGVQSTRNDEIVVVGENSKGARVVGSFPVPLLVLDGKDGQWYYMQWGVYLVAAHFKEEQFFVTHTQEYLLKLFDAGTGTVVREFRRDYPRVKQKNPGVRYLPGGTPFTEPEYVKDIDDLHVIDGRLWVQTSTVEPAKGVLFDVFDPEGRFVDSFFLKYSAKDVDPHSRKIFTFSGDYVYFTEWTEAGSQIIKKCRVRL